MIQAILSEWGVSVDMNEYSHSVGLQKETSRRSDVFNIVIIFDLANLQTLSATVS